MTPCGLSWTQTPACPGACYLHQHHCCPLDLLAPDLLAVSMAPDGIVGTSPLSHLNLSTPAAPGSSCSPRKLHEPTPLAHPLPVSSSSTGQCWWHQSSGRPLGIWVLESFCCLWLLWQQATSRLLWTQIHISIWHLLAPANPGVSCGPMLHC